MSFLLFTAGYALVRYPLFHVPTAPPSAPSPTSMPTPSPAPTAAGPTQMALPSPSPSPPGPSACEPAIRPLIEGANHAQADYIRGRGTAEALATAWGDAALEAQRQGDRLRQAIRALQGTMREIEGRIVDCAVAARPAPDRIEIQTHETWI